MVAWCGRGVNRPEGLLALAAAARQLQAQTCGGERRHQGCHQAVAGSHAAAGVATCS